MSDQPWEEHDAEDTPIVIVRSVPIPIRFEVRNRADEPDTLRLQSFYGARRLARRRVTPERNSERQVASPAAANEPRWLWT